MTRDIDKENKRIRNGNRYVVTDVDTLFQQYRNLRWKVYRTYETMLHNPNDKKDLKSYIDEQFIRLCKEYDINGEVDFAGYIKTMLNTRVHHVFIANHFRDKQRENLGSTEVEVQELYDSEELLLSSDSELVDLILDISKKEQLSKLKLEIISMMASGSYESDKKIAKVLSKKYETTTRTIYKEITQVRTIFIKYLK
mgnify:CR=1 FL=1